MNKIGRNDPCPCGSGKKYKQCCLSLGDVQAPRTQSVDASIHKNIQAALKHYQAGRLRQAEAICQQALQVAPNHPDALHLLGRIARRGGKIEIAVDLISKAISVNPSSSMYCNLGLALHQQRKLDAAVESYRKALSIKPDSASAHFNLGNALNDQGRLDEAVESYNKALSIETDFAEAHFNLGNTLNDQGKLDEAISSYQKALSIKPDFAEAYSNLGIGLKNQGNIDEAVECYHKALAIKPDYAAAHNNLGIALQQQGKFDAAIESYHKALLVAPDDAKAYSNLGNALKDQGRLDEAITSYHQALALRPDFAEAHSNLLLTMQYMIDVTPKDVFLEAKRYAERHETPLKSGWKLHRNNREPERRLKVGYVSGDFRNHAVANFIEPILASHDKSQVELYCYYNHFERSNRTNQIAAHADHWMCCVAMSDEQLAEKICADGIDILVDLSGHTAHNRLPVFARKPAPVQVSWIGYVGSTGLTAMDYRITDAQMDPPGLTERYHSETLVRLPETGGAYRPAPGSPAVNELPALTAGRFTFASLNNLTKINSSVVALWARLLRALPQARLMMGARPLTSSPGNDGDSGTQQRLTDAFAKEGIAAQRLLLQPNMSSADYLALHQQIDLGLDPFPYNGGTTTLDSLWMGVPVITLTGGHTVSRLGAAVLSRVGLSEFITHSEEEYVQRAMQFAQDLPGLNRIRQSLRERMSATSNVDPGVVTRHVESAYRVMWRKWCVS